MFLKDSTLVFSNEIPNADVSKDLFNRKVIHLKIRNFNANNSSLGTP